MPGAHADRSLQHSGTPNWQRNAAPTPRAPRLLVGHGAAFGCRRRCRRCLLGCLGRLGCPQILVRVSPGLPGRPGRRLFAPCSLLLSLLPPERPLGLLDRLLQRLPRLSCRAFGLRAAPLLLGSRGSCVFGLPLGVARAHRAMICAGSVLLELLTGALAAPGQACMRFEPPCRTQKSRPGRPGRQLGVCRAC